MIKADLSVPHDHSEIILICRFLLNVGNRFGDLYYYYSYIFFLYSLVNKKLKRTAFIKKNVVLQYTALFKRMVSVNVFFIYLKKYI